MAGLVVPHNLRLSQPEEKPISANDVEVEIVGAPDHEVRDAKGNLLQIKHDDGSITINLDGGPIEDAEDATPAGWYDNLAEKIDGFELGRIAEELLTGIQEDIDSRQEWVASRATGLKMLGLKVEAPNIQGASEGAPVEGMSNVRHPLMLEAVLRFQANARSELLPTDGPAKIRNDDNNSTQAEDTLSDALAKDFNHYLTVVDRDYYPDTDRMLFTLGFGGTEFKKGYFCPLRNRPILEWVAAENLIVNNEAKSLQTAKRITQRIEMTRSTVKRMQILGVYRDVMLSDPKERDLNEAEREKLSQQGITPGAMRPDDRDREMYECYCELNIKGYEHRYKGKESGLEIPYRVTIDLSSREILSIVRDYLKETEALPVRRKTFVQYLYIPGLGFYGIGLLHILGNTTNAITAAWREMLDNGMFANFPGFLIAKAAARQNTSILRVPPGGGQQIDTQGMDIGKAVMPLPYQTTHMAPLMQLVEDMATTGQRLGGTSEVQVGEGRADAPVGTTLAVLEQATKIENSVHKRLWTAQCEELEILSELFREHPESFWQQNRKPTKPWDEQTFLQALDDCNLVPQADPNTASHTARIIKYMGLKQLQAANPTGYDSYAVDRAGLRLLGFGNPDEFLVSPEQQAQKPPTPEEQAKLAEVQARLKDTASKAGLAAAKTKQIEAEIQQGHQQDTPVDVLDAQTRAEAAKTQKAKLALDQQEMHIENRNRDLDRSSHEKVAILGLLKDITDNPQGAREAADEVKPIERKAGLNPDETGTTQSD